MTDRWGRCIVCGDEFPVYPDDESVDEHGNPTGRTNADLAEGEHWWRHASDGVEASVCFGHRPDEVRAAHVLLSRTGAVVPAP